MSTYDAPYVSEEEHAVLDHTGIPGVGGSVEGFTGIWSYWYRNQPGPTVKDPVTGSFDWEADKDFNSTDESIVIDTRPEFADPDEGNWGYSLPQITVSGLYWIRHEVYAMPPEVAGDWSFTHTRLRFPDLSGDSSLSPNDSTESQDLVVFTEGLVGVTSFTTISLTLWIPEGYHVDPNPVSGTTRINGIGSNDQFWFNLLIQRVL